MQTEPKLRIGASSLSISYALALLFFILCLPRFYIPTSLLFDESYYIPAAAKLLSGIEVTNREQPMLGKEILAASIAVFGMNPIGWRVPSLVLMPLALFLTMRALWWFTKDAVATVIFGFLLVTSCLFTVLGRVGTLDAPMLFFTAAGAYAFARRFPPAVPGVLFGLSLATKWTIAPLLPVVALAWAMQRGLSWRSLLTGCVSFGILPLIVYAITFAPGFFVKNNPLKLSEFLDLHLAMAKIITGYDGPSAYPSRWWQWLLNLTPFWALAKPVNDAWRFVVLIVNPVSALFVIPAALLSLRRPNWLVVMFLITMALAISGKRLQFVHHYALPLTFAWALASLHIARLWRRGITWPAIAACALSGMAFVYIYPALSAAPLSNREAGQRFVLLPQWQFIDWNAWEQKHHKQIKVNRAHRRECLDHPAACIANPA